MDFEVARGEPLPHVPRLVLDTRAVLVGPYGSAVEHERHVLDTAGAGGWPDTEDDEYRFDRDTGTLVSALLHIPDAQTSALPWHIPPGEPAALRTQAAQPRPPAPTHWLSPDTSTLVCAYASHPAPLPPLHRVDTAPDFALLLLPDNTLSGWLLAHPDRHVTTAWEQATPELPDEPFRAAFTTYFSLTTPEAVEALEDGAPNVLSQLSELRDTIPLSEGVHSRRAALHHAVEGLLDFYG
ncbi:hypothetical protein KCV87_17675 [Actinosynnema pretiosum subsp. pretiosum]|uniref:Uncharacterized protein n=2 Tax=Actinosynnema TaxID=40566 RepID=C6WJA7_ACTMD|nr:hypothetical protein [Actinosynnema mirum]ACU34539.1 hypothetical protein Amir_0573 [Actinosynnema mirum DSM 43827]AXX27909.1 hypothetical protein APASM_0544 [Actinosynnema pretiosum subsp. pretiosum]QUF07662.1 hypothetical protein KCV87_17675 [Actinosynnema pretiosum subsp. pretiosum]